MVRWFEGIGAYAFGLFRADQDEPIYVSTFKNELQRIADAHNAAITKRQQSSQTNSEIAREFARQCVSRVTAASENWYWAIILAAITTAKQQEGLDKARLDWLEKQGGDIDVISHDDLTGAETNSFTLCFQYPAISDDGSESLRAAIDATMSSTEQQVSGRKEAVVDTKDLGNEIPVSCKAVDAPRQINLTLQSFPDAEGFWLLITDHKPKLLWVRQFAGHWRQQEKAGKWWSCRTGYWLQLPLDQLSRIILSEHGGSSTVSWAASEGHQWDDAVDSEQVRCKRCGVKLWSDLAEKSCPPPSLLDVEERGIYHEHIKDQLANDGQLGMPQGPCQCEICVKVRATIPELSDVEEEKKADSREPDASEQR